MVEGIFTSIDAISREAAKILHRPPEENGETLDKLENGGHGSTVPDNDHHSLQVNLQLLLRVLRYFAPIHSPNPNAFVRSCTFGVVYPPLRLISTPSQEGRSDLGIRTSSLESSPFRDVWRFLMISNHSRLHRSQ